MDMLVSNKSSSKSESLIVFGIFFIQMLSGFFDINIGVMHISNSTSDSWLNAIFKLFRFRGLVTANYTAFEVLIYILFAIVILMAVSFLLILLNFKKTSDYGSKEILMNFFLKLFIFVLFNPILDLGFSNLCFGTYNPNFPGLLCSSGSAAVSAISVVLVFGSILINFFLNIYYNDSYFLNNSFYARMNCGYEVLLTINSIIYSILLTQATYLGSEIFLIYNVIISLLFLKFYFGKLLFYDESTNSLVGVFHVLYVWTSIFFFVFAFINLNEKGVIYVIGGLVVIVLFFNLKNRIQDDILLNQPFHKITNKFHLLYYLKTLIDKIQGLDSSVETKSVLVGIIQHHKVECPNPACISKHKDKKIYLPLTDEWSFRDKPEIDDKVYLLNLVIIMVNYFISQNFYSPEMLMNISLYFIQILGNFCQAIFYFNKVREMKLSVTDQFSLVRLEILIQKALLEKLRPSSEICSALEELNFTLYYKYDDLSKQLCEEISVDLGHCLDFWKSLKVHHETGKPLDFNKIFKLTDKIRVTKDQVEKTWGDMFTIFSGPNEFFELYLNYVEQVNDDDNLKRELEQAKNKSTNSSDILQLNYYNILFSKETGIIIINGSKDKEGIIEKINNLVEVAFGVKDDEVRGLNITVLMPKMFEKLHKGFLERFVETGEKRRIDKAAFRSYAKDTQNCIIVMRFMVKLFPMLNREVYYCGMALKEPVDDIIIIDWKFNIQGMSKKLMVKFELENKELFMDNDIPFYVICKKFLNFYRMFLSGNRRRRKDKKHGRSVSGMSASNMNSNMGSSSNMMTNAQLEANAEADKAAKNIEDVIDEVTNENIKKDSNIEINENIELEYEICVPQFLHEYTASMNSKDKKSGGSEGAEEKDDDVKTPRAGGNDDDDADESEKLVEGHGAVVKEEDEKRNVNKQSDEEKEFSTTIKQYKNLFENGKFQELEDFINKTNKTNKTKELKFNFTFEKYKFGEDQFAFIIRCIDNKAEEFSQSANSVDASEEDKEKALRQQKMKVEALVKLSEVTMDDKIEQIEKLSDYLKIQYEDKAFNSFTIEFKEEIARSSRIFGIRDDDEKVSDEASSQNAGSGFNENMAKKTRIEEIRSSIMSSVSTFHTLKWIKAIFYFVIIFTAAFCGLYLMVFDLVFTDLHNISTLNIGIYQSTIWTCNIISTLISLRSCYNFDLTNYPISYNSFLPNSTTYFNTLRGFTTAWYDDVMTTYGPLEQQVTQYFNNTNTNVNLFWTPSNVSYPKINIKLPDYESLNTLFSHVHSDVNNLIRSPFFTNSLNLNNMTGFSPHVQSYLAYSSFLAIENAIDNLIPKLFAVLNVAPGIFTSENNGNMKYVIIVIVVYAITILIMIFLYTILLYLTNKNMEEGMEKVSKIKLNLIDDMIKKIETFNDKLLGKLRQKDNNSKSMLETARSIKPVAETAANVTAGSQKDYTKIFSEGQKYKRLQVLSYSYIQIVIIFVICCANLIPIYFVSLGMIDSSNQILSVQNYIFGLALTASANTVKIKCTISQCQTALPQNYAIQIVDRSIIESTIRDLTSFPDLSDFYNNKFLLNACAVIFDSVNNSTQYENCMTDVTIKSANNTDSMLKLIDETVSNILKDQQMKTNLPYLLNNGQTVMFTPPLLYETSNFMDLEYIFYNYITPISDNFAKVVSTSQNNFLTSVRMTIIILICVFVVCILIISYYIAFIFTNTLIHLLSVARLILKIIPTTVINNTQDLETWLENTY